MEEKRFKIIIALLILCYLAYLFVATWGGSTLAKNIANSIKHINCQVDCKLNKDFKVKLPDDCRGFCRR